MMKSFKPRSSDEESSITISLILLFIEGVLAAPVSTYELSIDRSVFVDDPTSIDFN